MAKAADCKSVTSETPKVRVLPCPRCQRVRVGLRCFPAKEVYGNVPMVRIHPLTFGSKKFNEGVSLMRVFIQTKENGKFHNNNFFKAYLGFSEMGLETVTFSNNKELRESDIEDVVVG